MACVGGHNKSHGITFSWDELYLFFYPFYLKTSDPWKGETCISVKRDSC